MEERNLRVVKGWVENKSLTIVNTTFYDTWIQTQRQTQKELKQKSVFLLLSLKREKQRLISACLVYCFTAPLWRCELLYHSLFVLWSAFYSILLLFFTLSSACLTKPFYGFLHFQLPVFPPNKMHSFGPLLFIFLSNVCIEIKLKVQTDLPKWCINV